MTHPPITGTGALTAQDASIAPAAPPHTYLGISRQLANAIQPLISSGPSCSFALAFVCAQTLECALKAYLSRSGDDSRVKEPAIRHNLEELWHLAEAEGLQLMQPTPSWVSQLSSLHDGRKFLLRYSTGVHGMVSPATEPMCIDIEQIVELVGLSCRPE